MWFCGTAQGIESARNVLVGGDREGREQEMWRKMLGVKRKPRAEMLLCLTSDKITQLLDCRFPELLREDVLLQDMAACMHSL